MNLVAPPFLVFFIINLLRRRCKYVLKFSFTKQVGYYFFYELFFIFCLVFAHFRQHVCFVLCALTPPSFQVKQIEEEARHIVGIHDVYGKVFDELKFNTILGLVDQADNVRKLKLEYGMNLNTFMANLRTGFIEWA